MDSFEELYDFAYCHPSKFDNLATLASPEEWGQDNRILVSYCRNLYKRAAELDAACSDDERRLILQQDGIACFDTGLYTERYESIYALFEPNAREDARQPWFLKGFFKASDLALRDVYDLPGRIRFTDDPVDLIYDHRLKLRVNIDHILGDENNLERIPDELKGEGKKDLLRRLFEGAVMEAERRAAANYMIAVPQYYNGRIQLLLPVYLLGDSPDLALAIQRESSYYSARTCLTLEMAYSNARLINRPESTWIKPEAFNGVGI